MKNLISSLVAIIICLNISAANLNIKGACNGYTAVLEFTDSNNKPTSTSLGNEVPIPETINISKPVSLHSYDNEGNERTVAYHYFSFTDSMGNSIVYIKGNVISDGYLRMLSKKRSDSVWKINLVVESASGELCISPIWQKGHWNITEE